MRTFTCVCGAPLFFDNVQCLRCAREVGWCPGCRQIAPIEPDAGGYRCLSARCGAMLVKCVNYEQEAVCNRLVHQPSGAPGPTYCDCCVHNAVIPDLSVEGHRKRWADLEAAKRRLFHTLDLVGLPHPTTGRLPLSFAFMTDAVPAEGHWRPLPHAERISTGHLNGRITINIREADAVERERLRADLQEDQRTLIGHFRHELGHYYWDLLVKGTGEASFVESFGDFTDPDYGEARARYYAQPGPRPWTPRFLSAYASMHPWEDFAETFGYLLSLTALLDTAVHWGVVPDTTPRASLEQRLEALAFLGGMANEMNRDIGLPDLLPQVVTPEVVQKLRYVDDLIRTPRASDDHPPPRDES